MTSIGTRLLVLQKTGFSFDISNDNPVPKSLYNIGCCSLAQNVICRLSFHRLTHNAEYTPSTSQESSLYQWEEALTHCTKRWLSRSWRPTLMPHSHEILQSILKAKALGPHLWSRLFWLSIATCRILWW